MNNDMPSNRGAQTIPENTGGVMASQMRDSSSSTVTTATELKPGQRRIHDPSDPGQIPQATNLPEIHFEGIGRIDNIDDLRQKESEDEGDGPFCVVLVDYLSGDMGNAYFKGNVRRLSKLVSGFTVLTEKGDPESRDILRQLSHRLFNNKAVRLADATEIRTGQADISLSGETLNEQAMRARLIEIEQENQRLQMALRVAESAKAKVTPDNKNAPPSNEPVKF